MPTSSSQRGDYNSDYYNNLNNYNYEYGRNENEIFNNDTFECSGDESSLSQCLQSEVTDGRCDPPETAGVVCQCKHSPFTDPVSLAMQCALESHSLRSVVHVDVCCVTCHPWFTIYDSTGHRVRGLRVGRSSFCGRGQFVGGTVRGVCE